MFNFKRFMKNTVELMGFYAAILSVLYLYFKFLTMLFSYEPTLGLIGGLMTIILVIGIGNEIMESRMESVFGEKKD